MGVPNFMVSIRPESGEIDWSSTPLKASSLNSMPKIPLILCFFCAGADSPAISNIDREYVGLGISDDSGYMIGSFEADGGMIGSFEADGVS